MWIKKNRNYTADLSVHEYTSLSRTMKNCVWFEMWMRVQHTNKNKIVTNILLSLFPYLLLLLFLVFSSLPTKYKKISNEKNLQNFKTDINISCNSISFSLSYFSFLLLSCFLLMFGSYILLLMSRSTYKYTRCTAQITH